MSRIIALFAALFAAPIAMAQDATTQDVAAAPAPTPLTPEEYLHMQELQQSLALAKSEIRRYQKDVAQYCHKPYKKSKKTVADKATHDACIERHDLGYQLDSLYDVVKATNNQLAPLQAKLKASQTVQNEATVEPPRYEDDRSD